MAIGRKRCGIVGAGPSGLPSARWAVEYGYDPVIFERDSALGGLWNYKPHDTEWGTVMKSTIINSSKEMSSFSDFPPAPDVPCYMHNRELLKYFNDYATHHDLHKFIRYRHTVTAIRRADDYASTGAWCVEYVKADANGGEEKHVERFDCVLICVGHHTVPYIPDQLWPGIKDFKGIVKHAHSYKNHVGYEDKTVVVVGVGNSALDIAVELSHVAKKVYQSTRRGAWIYNRVGKYGYPNDMAHLTRFLMCGVGKVLPTAISEYMWTKEAQEYFDHEKFGMKPNHGFFSQHITVNDELANRIISGTLVIKPNIAEFRGDNTVVFDNGTSVDGVDELILGTGYKFNFDFVEDGTGIPVKDNFTPLYKYVFPEKFMDKNTLGIIGHIQPIGGIMPIAEMQCRVFFEQITGRIKLPPKSEMLADIELKREEMAKRYTNTQRHTIQVDHVYFMDELAEMIGAKPDWMSLLLTDPKLAYALLFEANVSYAYRLNGPHQWAGAREAVLGARQRAAYAQKNRDCAPPPDALVSKKAASHAQAILFYALAAAIVFAGIYFIF